MKQISEREEQKRLDSRAAALFGERERRYWPGAHGDIRRQIEENGYGCTRAPADDSGLGGAIVALIVLGLVAAPLMLLAWPLALFTALIGTPMRSGGWRRRRRRW